MKEFQINYTFNKVKEEAGWFRTTYKKVPYTGTMVVSAISAEAAWQQAFRQNGSLTDFYLNSVKLIC